MHNCAAAQHVGPTWGTKLFQHAHAKPQTMSSAIGLWPGAKPLGPVQKPGFGPFAHTVWRRQVAEEVIDGVAACYQQMRDHDQQVGALL